VCGISHLEFLAERGGLYCCVFRNSLRFCYFARNARVFCRLLPSLGSLIRLSNAFPSLLWTSKVPKKSNKSNNPGFPTMQAVTGDPDRISWRAMNFRPAKVTLAVKMQARRPEIQLRSRPGASKSDTAWVSPIVVISRSYRQNFSRGPKRGGSGGVGVNTIVDSVQQEARRP
jgi:hypothetical protein